MERYTTHCTPEQTELALNLGAPIIMRWLPENFLFVIDKPKVKIKDEWFSLEIPTMEQMRGWLDEQIHATTWHVTYYPVYELYGFLIISDEGVFEYDAGDDGRLLFNSKEKAMLKSFDVVLNHLRNKRLSHETNTK